MKKQRKLLLIGMVGVFLILMGWNTGFSAESPNAESPKENAGNSEVLRLPAQTSSPYTDSYTAAGRFSLGLSGFLGQGIDDIDVGKAENGKTISISGGGGVGGALTLGFDFSSNTGIDVSIGMQHSVLSPKVSNMEGSFNRTFLLSTVKYKIPVHMFSHPSQVNIGCGIGYYIPGKLDIDGSKVTNGGEHDIVEYDSAIGMHIIGEYEVFFVEGWSFMVGIKYSAVKYDANSVKRDGDSYPVAAITNGKVRELDGSGIDLILGVARYF